MGPDYENKLEDEIHIPACKHCGCRISLLLVCSSMCPLTGKHVDDDVQVVVYLRVQQ